MMPFPKLPLPNSPEAEGCTCFVWDHEDRRLAIVPGWEGHVTNHCPMHGVDAAPWAYPQKEDSDAS